MDMSEDVSHNKGLRQGYKWQNPSRQWRVRNRVHGCPKKITAAKVTRRANPVPENWGNAQGWAPCLPTGGQSGGGDIKNANKQQTTSNKNNHKNAKTKKRHNNNNKKQQTTKKRTSTTTKDKPQCKTK